MSAKAIYNRQSNTLGIEGESRDGNVYRFAVTPVEAAAIVHDLQKMIAEQAIEANARDKRASKR